MHKKAIPPPVFLHKMTNDIIAFLCIYNRIPLLYNKREKTICKVEQKTEGPGQTHEGTNRKQSFVILKESDRTA